MFFAKEARAMSYRSAANRMTLHIENEVRQAASDLLNPRHSCTVVMDLDLAKEVIPRLRDAGYAIAVSPDDPRLVKDDRAIPYVVSWVREYALIETRYRLPPFGVWEQKPDREELERVLFEIEKRQRIKFPYIEATLDEILRGETVDELNLILTLVERSRI